MYKGLIQQGCNNVLSTQHVHSKPLIGWSCQFYIMLYGVLLFGTIVSTKLHHLCFKIYVTRQAGCRTHATSWLAPLPSKN